MQNDIVQHFCESFKSKAPLFYPGLVATAEKHPELFHNLAANMLTWAKNYIGEGWEDQLISGYKFFVAEVNRSQMQYEKDKKYKFDNYDFVNENVYQNKDFMGSYHWGVYVTTFAWEHHLVLFDFFNRYFLPKIKNKKTMLDLGAGSGIWSVLCHMNSPECKITSVDISERTVALAKDFLKVNHFEKNINFIKDNALTIKPVQKMECGISCFLLEHLETPNELLKNLSDCLEDGAYAFVTGALTASEIDHIFEFKRESELIKLAEDAGFRVVGSMSCAPESHHKRFTYLPRSMAMILQKRTKELW